MPRERSTTHQDPEHNFVNDSPTGNYLYLGSRRQLFDKFISAKKEIGLLSATTLSITLREREDLTGHLGMGDEGPAIHHTHFVPPTLRISFASL